MSGFTESVVEEAALGWGAKVIDRLAADLRAAFPEMKGFSGSNMKYTRFFAGKCPTGLIGQQPADQLSWFHLATLITKISADAEREWYAAQVIQHGWSRPTRSSTCGPSLQPALLRHSCKRRLHKLPGDTTHELE